MNPLLFGVPRGRLRQPLQNRDDLVAAIVDALSAQLPKPSFRNPGSVEVGQFNDLVDHAHMTLIVQDRLIARVDRVDVGPELDVLP